MGCACGGDGGYGVVDMGGGMEPRSGVAVLIRVRSDSAARGEGVRWGKSRLGRL